MKTPIIGLLLSVTSFALGQSAIGGFVATAKPPIAMVPIITDPAVAEHTEFWDRQIGTQGASIVGWSDGDGGFNGPSNSVYAAWVSIFATTSVSQPDPGRAAISKRSEATAYYKATWQLDNWMLDDSTLWWCRNPAFKSRLNPDWFGTPLHVQQIQTELLRVYYIKQDSLSLSMFARAVDGNGGSLSSASANASCLNSIGHAITASNDWSLATGWKPSQADDGTDPFNFDKLPSTDSHVKFQDVILVYTGTDSDGRRHYMAGNPSTTSLPGLTIISDQMNATAVAGASALPGGGGSGGIDGGQLRSWRSPLEPTLFCSMAPGPQVQERVRCASATAYSKEWVRVFAQRCIAYNPKVAKGKYAFSDGQPYVAGTVLTVTDSGGQVVYQNEAPDVAGEEFVLPVTDGMDEETYTVTASAPGYMPASVLVTLTGTEPVSFGTLNLFPDVAMHARRTATRLRR